MSNELQRYTLPDDSDGGGRVYTDAEELYLPSVSTVLDEKPTPEGIKHWKKKYDGTNGKKHWRDILTYKSNRGTLIHYNLLNEFADEEMYSVDEENSEEKLKVNGDWSRYKEDLSYAEEAWGQITQIRGIGNENVLNVECFVTNTGVGYAGQFDLLYVDDNNNIVLSDIKTSNADYAPYEKHKLQLSAYAHALELDVDTLEVLIIHPDSQTWKISHNTDWDEDVADLWADFRSLREGMGDVGQRMRDIANEGIDDAEQV